MGDYGDLDRADIASLIPQSDDYAWKAYESDPLRKPYIPAVIQELQLPQGSRGLDVGCGLGLQALLMAEAVGPDGHVTGLDISPRFLGYARNIAEKAGFTGRVDFVKGDLKRLPFEDASFDWIWSADAAGYPSREPLTLIKELARVVKPGGKVAILAWSSQQLLPGYPLLEARLNATSSGIAPFTMDMSPDTHWMRLLSWFEAAGLEEPVARTFVGEFQAPLSSDIRAALISLIEMRWPGAQSEITPEDGELYRKLCQPDSPDFILDVPGYYAFFTEILFYGRIPI
jgi:ubiquinone/menaquinone biosynthesis C-methylase UbiE